MIIKKASLADLKDLQDIGIRTYLPHYAHLWKEGGVDWYLQRCFADEVLKNELSDPNVEYYIISAEGLNIGILKLILLKALPDLEVENALFLEKIYFIKEWTGKGVGRETMQFVFDRTRELNRDCVWLKAMDTSDKPIAAYERAGFMEHARTHLDFEMMKEEYRGMIVLKKCF
jgi:diamine N-acetyltransferase